VAEHDIRMKLHLLCAGLFAEPEAEHLEHVLRPLAAELGQTDGPWQEGVRALPFPEGGRETAQLGLEYNRLFVLAKGHVPVQPYGGYWLDGKSTLYGPSLRTVERIMAAEGLEPAQASGLAPDHVVCELELMAHLASQGGKKAPLEKTLLFNHLARWTPDFCRAVMENTREEFYCAAAKLLEETVARDEARLAAHMGRTAGDADEEEQA